MNVNGKVLNASLVPGRDSLELVLRVELEAGDCSQAIATSAYRGMVASVELAPRVGHYDKHRAKQYAEEKSLKRPPVAAPPPAVVPVAVVEPATPAPASAWAADEAAWERESKAAIKAPKTPTKKKED